MPWTLIIAEPGDDVHLLTIVVACHCDCRFETRGDPIMRVVAESTSLSMAKCEAGEAIPGVGGQ